MSDSRNDQLYSQIANAVQAMTIKCPECPALEGWMCIDITGTRRRSAHGARTEAARSKR